MTLVDIEKLKAKISIAKKAVEDEKDDTIRIEAFKVILKNLIQDLLPKNFQSHNTQENLEKQGSKPEESSFNDPIGILAAKCKINTDNIRNVFEFNKGRFVLLKEPEGKTDVEIQIKSSLCVLTAYKISQDKEWIKASVLVDSISERGISLNHFSKNIGTRKDLIKKMGEKKGTQYGITTKGWQEGLELITSLSA